MIAQTNASIWEGGGFLQSKKTEGENKNTANQLFFSPSVSLTLNSSLVRGSQGYTNLTSLQTII